MRKRILVLVIIFLSLSIQSTFAEISFKPGAEVRIRHEFWKNIFDMSNSTKDNRNYFRIKYSVFGDLIFNENVNLFTKLTDEFKSYTYFYQASNRKKGTTFSINETVFDNLYLNIKNVLGAPVDLRLGRQNLFGYGEGFLIMDGTPLDGSRTFYFNAAKASWHLNDQQSLDFLYINNPRDDNFLPIINESSPTQSLNITNEEAYVLYFKDKSQEDLYWEGYYISKKESGTEGARLQSQQSRIYTPGVFVKYNLDPFVIRTQGAYQFGNYGDSDRSAWGGYAFLDRSFKDKKWSPFLSGGFIYLSGNKADTDDNEGWDPLFSRWPWMSELYSLSYNGESGLDYWTNLQMWRAEFSVKPTEKLKLSAFYNFLRANELPAGTSFALGGGKNRGHLPQFKASYAISKNVTTYFLAEYFIPGNFHSDEADDALFLRTEIKIKF